jgi:hypothetical protein
VRRPPAPDCQVPARWCPPRRTRPR